ncbi:MAG: hypothetical protein EOP50_00195 [Sphingobacteriales bacterium]|nr:MAG: hypothetical protein EOP50_00195 [Sphingobacteriales bacterium]
MDPEEEKPFKTNVEAAVAYLIGKGVIKKDGDVVERLKMSKGTFSAYKGGKLPPSKNFVRNFENAYEIKLSDFDPAKAAVDAEKSLSDASKRSVEEKYIALLEEKVNDQVQLQQLETRVDDLQRTVEALFARLVGGLEVTMECFADLMKKPEKDLKRKVLSKSHEQLREMASGHSHVDISS